MTVHQQHHIVQEEGGFYCWTCADQAATEADLRNTITRLEGAAKQVTDIWTNGPRDEMWITNDLRAALDALTLEIGCDGDDQRQIRRYSSR